MSVESTQFREPSVPERRLLTLLAKRASGLEPDWLEGLRVSNLDDGGMGSLSLFTGGPSKSERILGKKVAEHRFTDADGVEVLATLTVDQDGRPFELDVWKTDFSPLIRIPEDDELPETERDPQ